jgi:hypothetical protein
MPSTNPVPRNRPEVLPEGALEEHYEELGLSEDEYGQLMQSMRETVVCASRAAFEMRHVRLKAERCQQDTRSMSKDAVNKAMRDSANGRALREAREDGR